jgi:fatty-acyl-CoA synthase
MGLVGFCIAPMFAQASVDYIPTTTFGMRPLTWLKVLSDHGGTISFGPTFGYDLCVRRAANGLKESPDLSRWRVAGVGGEMVRADVLERFAERFGPLGFDRRAFVPSFGLAEATLAVTFTPLGEGVRVDRVDRTMYELTRRAVPVASDDDQDARKTRSFAYCGRPMPEYRIEIRDDNGRVLPERVIGRVLVTGPSLMDGYFANDEMTRQVLVGGGWLDTGDMGYLTDGYLVITGRRKDLIICKGRNIWPQDLEWVVETMPDVRTGSVAAFSVADGDDGERVVVVVESYTKQVEERAQLVRDIGAAINRTAGVSCEVVPVPARTLPYTSSGKLSRAAVKALYQQGLSWPDDPGEAPVVAQQQRPRVAAAAAGG